MGQSSDYLSMVPDCSQGRISKVALDRSPPASSFPTFATPNTGLLNFCPVSLVLDLWPSCPILSAGEVSLSSWTQPPRLLIHRSFSWPLLPSVEPEPHPLGLDLLRVRSIKAQGTDGLFVNGGKCPSGCLFLIPLNISCAHWNRQHLINTFSEKVQLYLHIFYVIIKCS